MEKKLLEEYFLTVFDLETHCYTQRKIESDIERVLLLKHTPSIGERPTLTTVENGKIDFGCMGCGGLLGFILFVIAGITLDVKCGFMLPYSTGIIFVLFGLLAPIFIDMFCDGQKQKEYQVSYNKSINRYNELEKKYKIQEEKEENVKNELKKGLAQLRKKRIDSEKLLKEYYDYNVCFPKYRNLIAVATIYEYLASGRCSELSGPDGAYNLFESETRQNIIITQLDQVIELLDRVQQNQYMLYGAMKKSNEIASTLVSKVEKSVDNSILQTKKLESISNNLESININSEIVNYNSERTNKELAYMNRQNYLSGNYNRL